MTHNKRYRSALSTPPGLACSRGQHMCEVGLAWLSFVGLPLAPWLVRLYQSW